MMESVYIALMFMLIVGIILSHTKMLAENLLFLYLSQKSHLGYRFTIRFNVFVHIEFVPAFIQSDIVPFLGLILT